MNDNLSLSDLTPIKAFAEQNPAIGSEASLRWQIFCAEQNGLADSGAIVRRGRRIFIVGPRYLAWMLGESRRAA